jgi:NADH:ubiquinone oxidoreductase subunit 4 (subunit M)
VALVLLVLVLLGLVPALVLDLSAPFVETLVRGLPAPGGAP